jgi:hypothetical protein
LTAYNDSIDGNSTVGTNLNGIANDNICNGNFDRFMGSGIKPKGCQRTQR